MAKTKRSVSASRRHAAERQPEEEVAPECPVCYEPFDSEPVTLRPCQHACCHVCSTRWLAKGGGCPICRGAIRSVTMRGGRRPENVTIHKFTLRACAVLDAEKKKQLRVRAVARAIWAALEEASVRRADAASVDAAVAVMLAELGTAAQQQRLASFLKASTGLREDVKF